MSLPLVWWKISVFSHFTVRKVKPGDFKQLAMTIQLINCSSGILPGSDSCRSRWQQSPYLRAVDWISRDGFAERTWLWRQPCYTAGPMGSRRAPTPASPLSPFLSSAQYSVYLFCWEAVFLTADSFRVNLFFKSLTSKSKNWNSKEKNNYFLWKAFCQSHKRSWVF